MKSLSYDETARIIIKRPGPRPHAAYEILMILSKAR